MLFFHGHLAHAGPAFYDESRPSTAHRYRGFAYLVMGAGEVPAEGGKMRWGNQVYHHHAADEL